MMRRKVKVMDVLTKGNSKSFLVIFCFFSIVIFTFSFFMKFFELEFFKGITVEAFGMLFDLLIIGFLINFFSEKGEKRRLIKRYLEELDDYRGWDEKEAMYRTVGIIRRLIKLGHKDLPLHGCHLYGADFSGFDLQKFKLSAANLRGANLSGTSLNNSDLYQADLQKANLQKANLRGTNLKLVNFREADLLRASLRGANLQAADLQKANLQWAKFQGAKLLWADLLGAKLYNADLHGVNLRGAILEGAGLQGAILEGADLYGADLRGANLIYAEGLTLKQLLEVKTLYDVEGLDPELEKELRARKPELFEKPK